MGQYSFKLPDVGEGTAEAEIAEWRVKVGDRVEEDQPLVDMMTDKATVELTSPVAGVVQSIAGKAGEKAAVGSVLVVLETAGSDSAPEPTKQVAAEQSSPVAAVEDKHSLAVDQSSRIAAVQREQTSAGQSRSAAAAAKPAPINAVAQAAVEQRRTGTGPVALSDVTFKRGGEQQARPLRGQRPAASPAVRRRADELGIKLQYVRGSGPSGRIMHSDLDAFLASEAAGETVGSAANDSSLGEAPNYLYAKLTGGEDVAVIGLRRQIAERMQAAKRHIPHFTYVEEVDVTELEQLRAHLNATRAPGQPKLTLLPFLMRALVRVLREFPQMNATYDDEAGIIHRSAPVHIGMAVQTTRGLLVAVIKHAEARDVWDCATEVSQLATVARDGKASREQLTGSTITITSLGPLGGVSATPVINRPEVAIIGPNKIVERPVVRDGQIVIRKMMNLSSSFDHRVIDGAEAAEFIQRLRSVLEQPATIFVR
ncbi:2-oxo acid dehydrogenase subunit E2 [Steroidobacter sp. S1-65]|uniref:Dihydrolipoamide acetyltransferase component of pyruvate dehydrogenase complex n=1 Tax=Steroidobacter gossypii TaxID=2805490 RepID=A0ABS1WWY0_9GAMM|nr:dihydrolipoamide acetyltransferase family protein [Steroidobacter gossypii]MBM0105476.1 2-oxo acid dehydrogenase subunit E2 [Steroidobacter gossypii]